MALCRYITRYKKMQYASPNKDASSSNSSSSASPSALNMAKERLKKLTSNDTKFNERQSIISKKNKRI